MRVKSHFEGTDTCELMLLLPQVGRVKCLSQSVHSGGRGGTPGAGSWEVAAFTRPGESCGSDTGNLRSLGSEMQIGVCAWPLSALIPQFPRVCSQNVRASSGHTRELRALPRTPILFALAHPFQNAPRHCESLIPRGNAREEKTKKPKKHRDNWSGKDNRRAQEGHAHQLSTGAQT